MLHMSIDSLLQPSSLLLQCLRLAAARTGVQVTLHSLQIPDELLLCITDRLQSCLQARPSSTQAGNQHDPILLQACQTSVPGTKQG